MKLVISNDVILTVKEYEISLKDYPISNSRRKAKVTKLMRALKGIRKFPMSYPICKYKDLGQQFDSSGNPLFVFLRQFNYEDESKFQWSFAFIIDKANKTITITQMTPSIFIKENNQYKTMSRIRLTESQLHNVIKRCVNEAIEEIYDNGYGIETNDGQQGFIVGQGDDSSVDVMMDGDKNVTRNMPWSNLKSNVANKARYNQYAKFMTSPQGKDYATRDKGWSEDAYNSHINHNNLNKYANESLQRMVRLMVLEELDKY